MFRKQDRENLESAATRSLDLARFVGYPINDKEQVSLHGKMREMLNLVRNVYSNTNLALSRMNSETIEASIKRIADAADKLQKYSTFSFEGNMSKAQSEIYTKAYDSGYAAGVQAGQRIESENRRKNKKRLTSRRTK